MIQLATMIQLAMMIKTMMTKLQTMTPMRWMIMVTLTKMMTLAGVCATLAVPKVLCSALMPVATNLSVLIGAGAKVA